MINSKGETIYTSAEIGYELGLSASTINAVGRRLWGHGRIAHWTLHDAQLIMEYVKSISVEEDVKRLARLHNVCVSVFGDSKLDDDSVVRKSVDKDIHLKEE